MKLMKLPNGVWIDPTTVLSLTREPFNPSLSKVLVKTTFGVIEVPVPDDNARLELDAIAAQINAACDPLQCP